MNEDNQTPRRPAAGTFEGKGDLWQETSGLSVLLGIQLKVRGAGAAYTAYPNLRKVRWLLPADQPAMRRAGIRAFYVPNSLQGRAFKRLISAGAICGERVWLDKDALTQLKVELARSLGEEALHLAFYTGMPGAYRKATAQVMTSAGRVLAYAKLASSRSTETDLETEHRTLLRLSASERLRGRVPRVLDRFDWQTGSVLLTTSGPTHRGPKELSNVHLEFFKAVFLPFAKKSVFGESLMWTRMSETAAYLKPSLPEPLPTYFARALEQLHDELGPALLPLSIAHRDFAPWNTRLGMQDIFVFDWGHAAEGVIPLYDAFHFQAIQAALFKRRRYLPDRRFLRDSLKVLWPEGQEERLPWLYLAYLVQHGLFYSEAQVAAPGTGETRVWSWFVKQIETFLEEGSPL